MPQITFLGCEGQGSATQVITGVLSHVRLLAAARSGGVPIRYGCGSCRCGTCAVRLVEGTLSPMEADESELLEDLDILQGSEVRLSCRARLGGEDIVVDLSFQRTYDPARRLSKQEDMVVYKPKKRKPPEET